MNVIFSIFFYVLNNWYAYLSLSCAFELARLEIIWRVVAKSCSLSVYILFTLAYCTRSFYLLSFKVCFFAEIIVIIGLCRMNSSVFFLLLHQKIEVFCYFYLFIDHIKRYCSCCQIIMVKVIIYIVRHLALLQNFFCCLFGGC